jgi:hypothetical protein
MRRFEGERFNVVAMEAGAGEQEITRSRLADEKIRRQRGERFNVVAMEAREQEITRSRLADEEIWR